MPHIVSRPLKESERENIITQNIDLFRKVDEIINDIATFQEYIEKQCDCAFYGHNN